MHTSTSVVLQSAGKNIKQFKIYRWDPEVAGQKPYIATYAVNLDEYVSLPAAARVYLCLVTTLAEIALLPLPPIDVSQMWSHDARCLAENQERTGPDAHVPTVRLARGATQASRSMRGVRAQLNVNRRRAVDSVYALLIVQVLPRGHLRLVRHEHGRHQRTRLLDIHFQNGGDGAPQNLPATTHARFEGLGSGHDQLLQTVQVHQTVAASKRAGGEEGYWLNVNAIPLCVPCGHDN